MSDQRMITKEQFDALIQKARMVKGPTREIFAKLAWNELPSAPSVECPEVRWELDGYAIANGQIVGNTCEGLDDNWTAFDIHEWAIVKDVSKEEAIKAVEIESKEG